METRYSFGDVKKFPAIVRMCTTLEELMQEDSEYGRKQREYVSKLLQEYNKKRNMLNKLDEEERKFMSGLIKNHFLGRIELSVMDERLKNPVRNYIIGIYRNIIKK